MGARLAGLALALLAALVLAAALPAQAQFAELALTINDPDQTAAPGGALTFHATLTNNTGDPVFLNGDTVTFGEPGSILDDGPFFTSFPLSLLDGESVTGAILDLAVSALAAPGTYSGVFTVLRGLGPFGLDPVASDGFRVRVLGGGPVVPEPGSLALLMGGLVPLGALLRRPRRG